MKKYLTTNTKAYNTFAEEYDAKWREHVRNQRRVLRAFQNTLRARYKHPTSILDVGCGVGLDAYVLTGNGYRVLGVDIARRMIHFARANAPKAQFRVGNFLSMKFAKQFHGVIMNGFIHLFPTREVASVLKKLKSVLKKGGVGMVSTGYSSISREGYFRKKGYKKSIKRYRKFWTFKELRGTLENAGFRVLHSGKNYNLTSRKRWINLIFEISS